MAQKDVDEQFAAIMAHWDEDARRSDLRDPVPQPVEPADDRDRDQQPADPTPAHDETSPDVETQPTPPVTAQPDPVRADSTEAGNGTPELPVGSAWRRHDLPELEEHFEPPPPQPLPSSEDKHFWTMLGALVGGPLLFLYLLLFNRDGNGWWMTFALLTSIAGFVLLVMRQPSDRDEDDDGIRL